MVFQANRYYLLSTFWCPSMLGHNRFRHRLPFYLDFDVQVTEEWLSNIFSQVLLSRARLIWFLYGFIEENPMDDLWVPPFMETSICFYVFESKLIHGLLISIGFRLQKPTVPTLENSRKSHRSSVRLEVGT